MQFENSPNEGSLFDYFKPVSKLNAVTLDQGFTKLRILSRNILLLYLISPQIWYFYDPTQTTSIL